MPSEIQSMGFSSNSVQYQNNIIEEEIIELENEMAVLNGSTTPTAQQIQNFDEDSLDLWSTLEHEDGPPLSPAQEEAIVGLFNASQALYGDLAQGVPLNQTNFAADRTTFLDALSSVLQLGLCPPQDL